MSTAELNATKGLTRAVERLARAIEKSNGKSLTLYADNIEYGTALEVEPDPRVKVPAVFMPSDKTEIEWTGQADGYAKIGTDAIDIHMPSHLFSEVVESVVRENRVVVVTVGITYQPAEESVE